MAHFSRLAHPPGWLARVRGVVLCRLPNDDAYHQPHDYRARYKRPIIQIQQPENEEGGCRYQHGTHIDTQIQRPQQLFHASPLLGAHQEDADDGEQNPHSCNDHRGYYRPELHSTAAHERRGPQGCRSQYRTAIALVEVGPHTGHIAHIIAHIIRNGGRVARVILRDTSHHLTYEVSPHISSFCVDTPTHTGKERLRRGPHPKGQHGGGYHHHLLLWRGRFHKAIQHQVPDRYIEQSQPHHHQPHNRPRAKSHLKPRIQGVLGSIGSTRRGERGGAHAYEARQRREEAPREECERHPAILHAQPVGQD